ncbi:MAG: NAD-dependent epimerase/dehydratase family protein, partial [Verrucomicrobia bacterium]|nr:NAD-dependent epimerase/dehydratase family protein [Verrucomicrobiota bacterium]
EERGFLRFQFTDGYSLSCLVFVARDLAGTPVSTPEADPLWVALDEVPYGEMWADDREWLPTVLEGGTFTGSFLFEGERMLEKDLRFHGPYQPLRGRSVLVAGCGFVGLAAARLMHQQGWRVTGCTHSKESAAALSGEPFPVLGCDISRESDVDSVLGGLHGADLVLHCASSGKGGADAYREVYLRGAQVLCGVLAPRQLLFTSSTSVYAQLDGGWVTEESPTEPPRETGRILLETERWVLKHGGAVARLAGIYGPGRSVLLRKFFSGEAVIEGDGVRWINQIHRDDAASGLLRIAESRASGVFNLGDSVPLPQRALYEALSKRFELPLPPEGPVNMDRKRGWTHKQVSNLRLRALGWNPQFPCFLDAVDGDAALVPGARTGSAMSPSGVMTLTLQILVVDCPAARRDLQLAA